MHRGWPSGRDRAAGCARTAHRFRAQRSHGAPRLPDGGSPGRPHGDPRQLIPQGGGPSSRPVCGPFHCDAIHIDAPRKMAPLASERGQTCSPRAGRTALALWVEVHQGPQCHSEVGTDMEDIRLSATFHSALISRKFERQLRNGRHPGHPAEAVPPRSWRKGATP